MGGPRVLDQSDVVRYLLDRGLLPPHTVVDGTVVVRDASSRNRIFAVDGGDTSSFVLKQGTSPEGVAAVAHEAAVYQLLGQRGDRMTSYLPTVWGYDTIGQVLILGKVSGDRDLRAHQVRTGRFSRALATSIGDALGALHRETAESVPATPERPTPWVLSVHQPSLSIFRDASSAALELIRIVQSAPELGDRLDALRRGWEPCCLIHHDVKWDNLIACPDGSRPRARFRLKIIDWEAAQFGDPRLGSGLGLQSLPQSVAVLNPDHRTGSPGAVSRACPLPAVAVCSRQWLTAGPPTGSAPTSIGLVAPDGCRLLSPMPEPGWYKPPLRRPRSRPIWTAAWCSTCSWLRTSSACPGSSRTPPRHPYGTGTMTAAVEMQIQDALDAVSIRSATSFSWFGDLSPNLSAVARRAMTGPATRDYLCYQLQTRLYGDFYCKVLPLPAANSATR